jgi:hypothetical protein
MNHTVKHFEYLGVTVSYDNEEELDIEKRTSKGNKARQMNRMLRREKSREQRRSGDIGNVNEEEIKLEAWERKMLRKIFRGTRTEDGGWRRKTNGEIKEPYSHSPQRIRWLGHVGRMPGQRHAKRALLGEEERRRGENQRRNVHFLIIVR